MRLTSYFTLFVCLVALSDAAPVPASSRDGGTEGKGKERERTEPPPSTHASTAAADHHGLLPGRNGITHNWHTGITTAHYGDDRLPEHMGHLQRNQALHPGNRKAMRLANDREHDNNRDEALHGIPSGGNWRGTHEKAHLDEKHIAMLYNEHHSKTTTVERVPESESHIEGALTSHLKSEMQAHGSKGQLRANPGWLALHPHQRVAHEAPARLNSEVRRPNHIAAPKKSSRSKPDPHVLEAERKKKEKGYRPEVHGSDKELRHRKGVPQPPPPVKKEPRPASGKTNLTPGRVSPQGHIWHPNTQGASHAGAPRPVSDAHTNSRHPPRPQDHDHYMRQQHAAKQAALQHPAPARSSPSHPGPKSKNPAHNTAKFKDNLAKFTASHPPHAPAHGAHPAEAPVRLHHGSPAPHHNAPGTSHHAALAHRPAPPSSHRSAAGQHATTQHHATQHPTAQHHAAQQPAARRPPAQHQSSSSGGSKSTKKSGKGKK